MKTLLYPELKQEFGPKAQTPGIPHVRYGHSPLYMPNKEAQWRAEKDL
jgi:hypothetical protein